MPVSGGRDKTIHTSPVLIPSHGTYTICRKAELIGNNDGTALTLQYYDGTGTEHTFKDLSGNGTKYTLSFVLAAPIQYPSSLEALHDPRSWKGNVTTGAVEFQVSTK